MSYAFPLRKKKALADNTGNTRALMRKSCRTMKSTGKRAACFAQGEACLRCQRTDQGTSNGNTYLLLGPHNNNVREAMVRSLDAANMPYRAWKNVLALPTLRPRVSGLPAAFLEHLPEATAQDVTGVFFSGDLDDAASALAAFIQAEPLTALVQRAKYDWVRDALEDGWLFSLFHPIVDAGTGAVFATRPSSAPGTHRPRRSSGPDRSLTPRSS